MNFTPKALKIVLFSLFIFHTLISFSQTTIVSQSFDSGASGYSDDLNYTVSNSSLVTITATTFDSAPNSMQFNGTSGSDTDITFDDVDISTYTNVSVTISFASIGVDNREDLDFYVSYNGGANYSLVAGLIDGDGGETHAFGDADTDASTTNSNPYTFNVPAGNSSIRIQIQSENLESADFFYIDNVIIKGIAPGPEIDILGNGNSIVNGSTAISVTDDTDFGNVDEAIGVVSHTFTIENLGTTNLTLDNPSPYVVLTGDTADFTLTTNPTTPITSLGSTTFIITFNPTSLGTKTATISIANNDTDENPYTFNVEGVGSNPTYSEVIISVDWPSWSSENKVEIYSPTGTLIATIDNGFAGGTDDSYSTTVNLGCLEDLNNYYFIMYDTYGDGWNGADNITITSSGVTIVNQDDGDLASVAGSTVNFNVSGGICGPEIDVLGNGTSIADGETVTSITNLTDFDDVETGSSFTRTFTIENTGGADLTIGAIVSLTTGTLFTVTTQPAVTVLASNTSTTFSITFSPIALGTFSDVVTITNDDSDENPYTFTIQGTGVTPLTVGPGGITTDLKLWLKATSGLGYVDGASVSLWTDQGRGSNATVNTAGQEPTYRDNAAYNVNFNPVVDFDNSYNPVPIDDDFSFDDTTTQFLEGTGGLYTQDMFVVLIPDVTVDPTFGSMDVFCGDEDLATNETDATGIGLGAYTSRFTSEILAYAVGTTNAGDGYGVAEIGTGNTYNNVGIINARNNAGATQQELYYNANNVETNQNDVADFSNVNNSRYWIGRSEGWEASTDARIAEIITYSSRQDDTSIRPKIESYLAVKYGITLGVNGTSQDYVDSFGNVIWDISVNTGFNYNIAGIGQDDDSELNQKQSKSVNPSSIVAIGLDEVATTNNANGNNFATDLDFLMWGSTNGNFNTASEVAQSVNLSGSTTTFTPVSRKWKILETQNDVAEVVISIITTDLTSNIPLAADEEYMLVVSDNSSFASTAIIDVVPLTTNGSNSEVWYDFDGTKYFTIAKATRVEAKRRIDFTTNEFLIGDKSLELNTTDFTVSAWVQNNTNGGSFISKGTGYNFKINGSNKVEIDWNGSTKVTSTNTVDSNWHHIALTYSSNTATLYIDGVLDITVNSLANPSTSTNRFAIGALYTNKSSISSFDGTVDEVRIWDSALTATEIRYIMNQEIEEFSTTVDGEILPQSITKNDISSRSWSTLQAYYDMNAFYGTTVEDRSSNKHWGRIKYLTKDKLVVETQTAPLPYESTQTGNWDTAATWLNNTVQYLPNTTLYGTQVDWNIVETNNNVNTTRNVTVLGLKNNVNELSVNADNSLTISHYLLLDGVIDLDGESQLIQTTDSDFDAASTGYLERDQQGEGNLYRYNDWASPVYTANDGKNYTTVGNSLKDGTVPSSPGAIAFTSGYDGSISPLTLSTAWLYKYADNPDGDYSSWEHVSNTGTIYTGEGFLMKGADIPGAPDQNYVFVGKPNNGTVSLNVSGGYDYLIGNPYASAIDANQFILDNSPSGTASIGNGGALYFWEHYGGDSHNLADYQAGYATYSLGGGVPATAHASVSSLGTATKTPGRYIAVSQGFFVVGDTDGGTIEFNNGQRIFVKEGATSVFMKSSNLKSKSSTDEIIDNRPKYRIGFNAPEIDHRQLLLTIDENTTDAVDWGYDSKIYEIFEDDMYWIIEDEKYVIQATNTFSLDKEIPLGIQTSKDGIVTIKVDALENVEPNTSVYVKDNLTGETVDITNQSYEVNLDAGEYPTRFVIAFQQRLLSVDEVALETGIHIVMNNTISELQIHRIIDTEIENITLHNYLGQQVKAWNSNLYERFVSLPIQIATGVYIVRVNSNAGTITKKIIIE